MEPYLPNYLKGKNRRLVFDLLRERGQMSRAEITRDTGMSFPTAMKVVDAFLEKGLLVELDETGPAAGAGRKGRLLRFEPGAYRAVGVECEGRFARVGLADMAGGVQARETIELGDFARTRDLSPLAAQVFPAFWREVELPVYLENDANLACEGEAFLRRGAGGAANMLYLSIGSGCGGAVRLDGKLRRGARCRAGEVGAMLLQPALGAPGRSAARETLEDAVCLAALERRFGAALRDGAQPGEASAQAMQLCTQVSEALRAALPESTPVRVEPSVSADAGVIGAAATVFERSLDALLGSGCRRSGTARACAGVRRKATNASLPPQAKQKTDSQALRRVL